MQGRVARAALGVNIGDEEPHDVSVTGLRVGHVVALHATILQVGAHRE